MVEKAVRKTTKKTVRKAAPKKAASKAVGQTRVRKAPTSVAAQKAGKKKNNRLVLVGLFIFLSIIGGSIALGISGDGAINIEDRVSDLKEQATPEERTIIESVPVKTGPTLPDGGLVQSGVPEEKPVVVPVATSTDTTASSTDEVATTTDATAEISEEIPEEIAEDDSVEEVIPIVDTQ